MALHETMYNKLLRRVVMVGVTAVVLGGGLYWYLRPTPEVSASASVTVQQGAFTIRLTEVGELRALESITISAQKDLPIIYLVPEGSYVKEGDVLVRFDSSKYEAQLEESIAAMQVAEAQARQAESNIQAQKEKLLAEIARYRVESLLAQLDLDLLRQKPLPDELEKARMQLERAKFTLDNAAKQRDLLPEFVDKGFVTKSTLAEAELKHLEATANLQAAQFAFDKVAAGAMPQELEAAQIRLRQARFSLEKAELGMTSQVQSLEAALEGEKASVKRAQRLIKVAQVKLDRTELRAPQEGIVVYAAIGGERSGEKVQLGMIPFEGQPILFLPDLSTIVVDTVVNEIDIGKVQLGGIVEVRMEAYPDAVFHGTVLQIASLAKFKHNAAGVATSVKVFDVTVKIEEQDSRLRPGLTATLDFIVEHHENVVSVPLSAIIARQNDHLVLVSKGGRITERKVVLGPSNTHRVLVEQGLDPGEEILLSPHLAGIS